MTCLYKTLLTGVALMCGAAMQAQSPKYIFLFIGDGMGMGPVVTAQTYNRTILGNDKPLTMMQMPVAGMCLTYSANSDITDSAAAGTALSTGHKTKNGMLGQDPDTCNVTSMAVKLHEMGYGIGVVTSVSPDDATPAAFYAHVPNRKMYYQIGSQMAECGFEFIAGAGLRGVKEDGKETDLINKFAENNVQIVRGPKETAKIDSRKVLLLNTAGTPAHSIGYTIDSIADRLTLPQITQTCLDHLLKYSPDKFFMMVEGGNIDHALHANDGGAAIKEVLNFDSAIDIAFQFAKAHPDETLIVVTADHDTGALAQVHAVKPGGGLKNIDYQRISKDSFNDFCKSMLKSRRIYTWEDMKEYLAENLGLFKQIQPTKEQTDNLEKLFDRAISHRNSADQQTLYANFNEFAVEVFKIFNDASGIGFRTLSHSGNPVPVFAAGVGADRFKSLNNNIDIPADILDIVKGK